MFCGVKRVKARVQLCNALQAFEACPRGFNEISVFVLAVLLDRADPAPRYVVHSASYVVRISWYMVHIFD